MSLNVKNIKKWWKMVRNKSILHVEQSKGKCYSFSEIKGYYNDLRNKVLLDPDHYKTLDIVKYSKNGNYFPIAVFQYGLGSYDLFLEQNNDAELMHNKFLAHLNWAFDNQNSDGSWNNFIDDYPDHPFSSMAQGEGASLLIRGYIDTGDTKFLEAAKNAIDFMLKSIDSGGTSIEDEKDLILYEFTFLPYVYNGWMFSIFGLMDYCIVSNSHFYKEKLDKTIKSLKNRLDEMDNGYWSMYRHDKTIASPFYHHLHIAQLQVLAEYSNDPQFDKYSKLFVEYESNKRNKRKAFRKKALQKIFSKN